VPELFQRVAELRPESPLVWIGRGQYRALRSQWEEAVSDYARANPSQPITDETFEYAALLLLTGNEQGYQQFCADLVTRDEDLNEGHTAFVTALTCSLGPASEVPPEQLVEWANRALQEGQDLWLLHALGFAHYRAGQFQQAIETLEKSNAVEWSGPEKALNDLVLAMANYSDGRQEEAWQWLQKATATIDAAQPTDANEPANVLVGAWIAMKLLRREAERLLEPNDTTASEQSKSEQEELSKNK
jgi:tetratricopeptide (TPR) repeat protein